MATVTTVPVTRRLGLIGRVVERRLTLFLALALAVLSLGATLAGVTVLGVALGVLAVSAAGLDVGLVLGVRQLERRLAARPR